MVYASQEMYVSPEYVTSPYAYPAAYPVYAQETSDSSEWSNVAMLAVAGAVVGGVIGYKTKAPQKRAVSARAGSPEMKAALLYSTSTGNTETAAGYLAAETGLEAVDIGDVDVETIKACDSLIVGAPTWNTGADEERSGTAWDELATCFEKQGATIVGAWPTAGYEHEESKS